jgi:hypothetical protein
MTEPGKCGHCLAPLEPTIAHVCPVEFWSGRAAAHDPVARPRHYTSHPSGIECIQIAEHLNFCLGNAVKYIWRAGEKEGADDVEDLEKAQWYLGREIERRRLTRQRGGSLPRSPEAEVRDLPRPEGAGSHP